MWWTSRLELKTLAKLTDEDLLRLMIAGDENAFTTLYQRRQGNIYRFALQMTGCRAKAEEVTQETFMVLIPCFGLVNVAARGQVACGVLT